MAGFAVHSMAVAARFEDLIAWQRARELTLAMYRLTRNGAFAEEVDLRRQIRRAAISVMANIAEGFERNRLTEFHQYLSVSKASCGELRSHLFIAFDVNHLTEDEFFSAMDLAKETSRVIGGLRASIQRKIASKQPKT